MADSEQGSKEINVVIDNGLINHLFFYYLEFAEKQIIINRLLNKQSVVCGFKNGDRLLFCCVLDFEPNCLHVREVAGFFGKIYQVLDTFTQGFAKFLQIENVTFNTEKRAIKKWADKAGFRNFESGEYIKRIH